jgi:hypothetical protein
MLSEGAVAEISVAVAAGTLVGVATSAPFGAWLTTAFG